MFGLEPGTQVGHGDIDDVRDRVAVDAPHRLKEPIAPEHLALVSHEMLEQVELEGRELDDPIPAPHLVRRHVHHQIGALQKLAAAFLATSKQRPHPREELCVREGLDEIVVRAGIQARYSV